jgi:uncharacterized membrane protein
MMSLLSLATQAHVAQILSVENVMVLVLVHVCLITLAILTLVANLNALPTMSVIDLKHVFKRSAKTLVLEFVVLMLSVKHSTTILHVLA